MAKVDKQKQSGIISDFYEEEAGEAFEEVEVIQISIPVRSHYKFMLEALADRFRVPMARISRPILEEGLFLAFSTLSDKDQDKLAAVADQKNHDFLLKQYGEGNFEQHGMRFWDSQSYCLQRKDKANEAA